MQSRSDGAGTPTPPAPGSPEELARFDELQRRLGPLFEGVFADPGRPRTVVIVPSLTLDANVLEKVAGAQHYEERLLCMLLLLRMPRTRIVYVTSTAVDPIVVEYYLQLLPGVPGSHARRRLTLFHCDDATLEPLAQKILDRPRLLARVRAAIGDPRSAHLSCFNATPLERTLAVRLGIPLYACDPALADLGGKSGSREVLRAAEIPIPDGHERLRDEADLIGALAELRHDRPDIPRAVIKLEEGFSGEGNAVLDFDGCPKSGAEAWITRELPRRLRCEAPEEEWETYREKFRRAGGVCEVWIDGADKRSPSAQGRIDPLRRVEPISTHDQVLEGPSGQVFVGSTFPAREAYRLEIQELGQRVGAVLRDRGALGRFGVDFVSVPEGDGWRHYAIEINLRKGGTTHTFRTLQFLTGGAYDADTGLFHTPGGRPCYYRSTDTLYSAHYRRLTPVDLIDVAVENRIHFDGAAQAGTVFHLIGALSGHGKLGMVCVGGSPQEAMALYHATVEILDRETSDEAVPVCSPPPIADDLE